VEEYTAFGWRWWLYARFCLLRWFYKYLNDFIGRFILWFGFDGTVTGYFRSAARFFPGGFRC
jgi:hypothetical protein